MLGAWPLLTVALLLSILPPFTAPVCNDFPTATRWLCDVELALTRQGRGGGGGSG